ncbi:ABC transporter ATP-binding protein [Methylobacterium sp. yr668]|uniref:ABC transporter ATP-binding protein n=1 Tax=Methylobacterium sp. yr668 TaxID=1761801 RepID=UPI0008ECFAA0|nr:ABC transporter ATP-binding protein [Methylobacterium sp. yr668]SFT26971.1 ATP-binding cassette, subfamily B [Methylobacterium sp. yr668]
MPFNKAFSSLSGAGDKFRLVSRIVLSFLRLNFRLSAVIVAARMFRVMQPTLTLLVAKLIIDTISHEKNVTTIGISFSQWIETDPALKLVGLIFLEFLLVVSGNVAARLTTFVEASLFEVHNFKLATDIIRHVSSISLENLENSKTQDLVQRANTSTIISQQLVTNIINQIQGLATIVLLSASLFYLSSWFIFLIAISFIPSIVTESYFNRIQYEAAVHLTPDRRLLSYLQQVGTALLSAKEVKIFRLGPHLVNIYNTVSGKISRTNRVIAKRRAAVSSAASIIGSLAYYLSYCSIVWQTLSGRLSIGDLVFFSGVLLQLNAIVEGVVLSFTQIASQSNYMRDFYSLIDSSSSIPALARSSRKIAKFEDEIVFKDVGFRYTGGAKWVFRNLNFTIRKGEMLAFVGENGAGKSTVIKLLARLYMPTEGTITIDGVDIADIDLFDYYSLISVVLQDFVKYNMTARENISISSTERSGSLSEIIAAAEKSLADSIITSLPGKYDQMLGMNFAKSVDLSGGQWQKVAGARAFFKNSEILIMDEPTAALDTEAGIALMRSVEKMKRDTTVVIVCHNLSLARNADRIIVFEQGEISENGSHEELLRSGGQYARIFNLQAAGFE